MRIWRRSSQKTVSEGLWPGRWRAVSVRSRRVISSPSRRGIVTCPLEPKARNAAPTEPSAVASSAGTPWRRIMSIENASSAVALALKSSR